MAKQDVKFELLYDAGSGADWQEQVSPVNPDAQAVFARQQVTMTRGAGAEGQPTPPSTAALLWDNRTGKYNPANAMSPLYGLVGRNTPTRISIGSTLRSTTEAATWAPSRAIGGSGQTGFGCAGILRRLGMGKTPVRSPAYRTLTTAGSVADMIGYWPLEEESLATALEAYLPAATITASALIDFGKYANHPATARMATFGAAGQLRATVAAHTATGEYKVCALWNMPATTAEVVIYRLRFAGGTLGFLDVAVNHDSGGGPPGELFTLLAFDAGGAFVGSGGTSVGAFGGALFGTDCMVSLQLTQSGGNISVTMLVVSQTVAQVDGPHTITGVTMGTLLDVTVGGNITDATFATSDATGLSVGHLVIGTDTGAFADFISPNADGALGTQAYAGEHAGFRFLRLCTENGITGVLVGDQDDTQLMGVQPVDTLVKLLQQCVDTDAGLMFEPADQLGVTMRTGRDLYNQASKLALDVTDNGVTAPLAPVLDDQGSYNDVTVVRYKGSQYRAILGTGPMSILEPPAGIGPTDRKFDVNTSTDAALADQAYWRLARGTVDEPRWPQITVDLDAVPSLVVQVEAVDIGDRITGVLADWPADPASLLVLGIQETVGTHRRLVTFVTVPASVFDQVGIVGADDGSTDLHGQAIDTDDSTLAAAITTTNATTFTVASTGGVLWTTDPDDWSTSLNGTSPSGAGLFIVVAGETMRVTSITGASSPQTFTVVRSVNGVTKTHATGSPVHVRYPFRVGL